MVPDPPRPLRQTPWGWEALPWQHRGLAVALAVWDNTNQMKLRKRVLVALLGIVAGCGILFGALFAALHSPWLLNRLANASGYDVNARTISLSPSLSGSISGLSIKRLRDDSLTLLASNVTAKSSLNMILRGEVDSLVLQNPKVTFRIGKESKGASDFPSSKNFQGSACSTSRMPRSF